MRERGENFARGLFRSLALGEGVWLLAFESGGEPAERMVGIEIPFDAAHPGRFGAKPRGAVAAHKPRHDLAVGQEALGAQDVCKLRSLACDGRAHGAPRPEARDQEQHREQAGRKAEIEILGRKMRKPARMSAQTPMSTIR